MLAIVAGILVASAIVGQGDGNGNGNVDAFPAHGPGSTSRSSALATW
jgi:hypothetical protein